MVKIMFSTQRGILSAIIRFFTWSRYSHVDFIVGPEYLIGPYPGVGTQREKVARRKQKASRWVICEFDASHEKMRAAMESIIGKPYDWGAIFGFVLRQDWQDDRAWFCSEAIAWASRMAGTPLVTEKAWRVTPRDLLMSPRLRMVEKS